VSKLDSFSGLTTQEKEFTRFSKRPPFVRDGFIEFTLAAANGTCILITAIFIDVSASAWRAA